MATRIVQLFTSDLTGKEIEKEQDRVEIRVLDHPDITRPVKLDAYALEVQSLLDGSGDHVTLELVLAGGEVKKLVVPAEKFAGVFQGDVAEALGSAESLAPPRSQNGSHPTRRAGAAKRAGSTSSMSPEQRGAVREWANNNGYTVGDRGRIKAEIVAAFEAAH